ncbi:MAG: GAF domain-containing protein [Deltaproteobacteria bacterium]|nr:GAF domain-containing protein [Deltaproteobacteria bacterium]
MELPAIDNVAALELLYRVGISLGAERNKDRLLETILVEAKTLCNADGGTLYLRTDDDQLRFAIMRTDSLGIAVGGTSGAPILLPPLPLFERSTGAPNHRNVATAAALLRRSFNIPDAYDAAGFDFSGTKAFDARNAYRSTSFLAIPLVNQEDHVIGVLQLLNARARSSGAVVPFSEEQQRLVEALAAQAGTALDNKLLLDGQRVLLESFIKAIAEAIDAKSAHTGGHCERVPVITELLAEAACAATEGPFAGFQLDEDGWYELRIAAWLHDAGKVTTPVHVMDKATKLEAISDRVQVVRMRFELLRRDAELEALRARARGEDPSAVDERLQSELGRLAADLEFLERANVGGEFLGPEDRARIAAIGATPVRIGEGVRPLLDAEETACLQVSRGTLTDSERRVINGHMVETITMLESLPFPRNLARVPEYAAGHHEKMDGTGYPRGVYAGDMSIPARILAIADVFEALTAADRPYKRAKTLSETMRIMGAMKRDNHLDPELFDLFVRSGVYRRYATENLAADLVDAVDEAALLAIVPRPFEPPPADQRAKRRTGFLPEYQPRPSRAPESLGSLRPSGLFSRRPPR